MSAFNLMATLLQFTYELLERLHAMHDPKGIHGGINKCPSADCTRYRQLLAEADRLAAERK